MTGGLLGLCLVPLVVALGNWVADLAWRRPARRREWRDFIEREYAKGPMFRQYTLEELQSGRFQ